MKKGIRILEGIVHNIFSIILLFLFPLYHDQFRKYEQDFLIRNSSNIGRVFPVYIFPYLNLVKFDYKIKIICIGEKNEIGGKKTKTVFSGLKNVAIYRKYSCIFTRKYVNIVPRYIRYYVVSRAAR